MSYFFLFFQSNLLEMPAYIPFLMRREKDFFTSFTLVTAMNAITHPIVFFFIMNLKMTYLFNILLAECFAVFAEAWLLRIITGEKYRSSSSAFLLVSLFANFLSWQISPMMTYAVH